MVALVVLHSVRNRPPRILCGLALVFAAGVPRGPTFALRWAPFA
jgi:hypothetical protein